MHDVVGWSPNYKKRKRDIEIRKKKKRNPLPNDRGGTWEEKNKELYLTIDGKIYSILFPVCILIHQLYILLISFCPL